MLDFSSLRNKSKNKEEEEEKMMPRNKEATGQDCRVLFFSIAGLACIYSNNVMSHVSFADWSFAFLC